MAIEDLNAAIPIWVTLYSQGSNGSWGSIGKGNAELTSYNGAFAEFVWDVADIPAAQAYKNIPFCAASTTNIGLMLQTGAAVTAAGTVSVFIKSIEIRPAGYVPQGAGGNSGVPDGTAGRTNTAGAAGWPATTRSRT